MSLPRCLVIALLLLGVVILSACRPITRTAVTPVATVKARPVVAAKAPKLVAVENGQAIFSGASHYYRLSCVDWINVDWLDKGTWKNVGETLPSGYFIRDGKPVEDWDCDVVMCSPIEEYGLRLIKVRLDRYEQIGEGADTYPAFPRSSNIR